MTAVPSSHPPGLLRPALGLALITLLVAGLGYALLATGLGRVLFPAQAQGSLLEHDGRIVGSSLVGQPFVGARWFVPRPSAADYDPMAMAGSNLARGNPALQTDIEAARQAVAAREGLAAADVPDELITRSGSGIDPHIGPATARVQVARVAAASGLDPARVQALVDAHTQGPTFGLFGAARVNVLALNLALDAQAQADGAE